MGLFKDKYAERTLDFVEDLRGLTDYDSLCQRILVELEWFGYSRVTVWSIPGPGAGIYEGVLLNTRPIGYNEHYEKHNYVAKDPLVLELRHNVQPFSWDDVRNRRLSKPQRRIIDEGREFDARNGLIIPIHTASGSLALFSPCGRDPDLSPRAVGAMEMIGIYAHQALQRAMRKTAQAKRPPIPLTSREREVLKWVATGKGDDEIAVILNISRETATKHVENAKHKLDATRRTYAVVQALRFGEITL